MSPLPKHLRPRYRYLAIKIETHPDRSLTRQSFQHGIWDSARELIGDAGSARVDLHVMRFRFTNGNGDAIVRTNRATTSEARAAITTLTEINNDPIRVHVKGISGTIQACEEKYLGQDPESVIEQSVVFNNELRAAVVRDTRIDVKIGDGFTGATTLDVE